MECELDGNIKYLKTNGLSIHRFRNGKKREALFRQMDEHCYLRGAIVFPSLSCTKKDT